MAEDQDQTKDQKPDEQDDTNHDQASEESVEDLKAEIARMQKALKDRNKEEAARRKKLEALEKAEEERQQAAMTEAERLKSEKEAAEQKAEEAEQKAKETLIQAAFAMEAAKQGAAHPTDVYALADKTEVEVGQDGTVTGVAEAVTALVDAGRIPLTDKDRAPSLDAGAGGGDRPGDKTKLSAEQLRVAKAANMTPEAYAKQLAATETIDEV